MAVKVRSPKVTVTVAGEQASQLRLRLGATFSAADVVRHGLRYRVACVAACSVSAVLREAGGDRQRLGAAAARRVRAGASRVIVIRLDRAVRRNLVATMRRAGVSRLRTKLATTVRDEAGRRTVRKTVVLKR